MDLVSRRGGGSCMGAPAAPPPAPDASSGPPEDHIQEEVEDRVQRYEQGARLEKVHASSRRCVDRVDALRVCCLEEPGR
eukprot:12358660-Heterocapsa_arctica.AAC.1